MARTITPKQKKFAREYLETGNGLQSALKVYDTEDPSTAGNIASENLNRPNVIAYLESKANRAAERVVELSEQDEALPVALGASKDILDRAGYKPVEKSAHLNITTELPLTEEDKSLLEVLKEYARNHRANISAA